MIPFCCSITLGATKMATCSQGDCLKMVASNGRDQVCLKITIGYQHLMVNHDMVWYGMVGYGMVWSGVVCNGLVCNVM